MIKTRSLPRACPVFPGVIMAVKSTKVVFERGMINSNAFRSLSKKALQVLCQFLARRKMKKKGRYGKEKWIIINNGEIEFSYRDAENKLKISNRTYTRALDELIEKGFISIAEQGNGTGGGRRTKYSIDDRWQRWGKPDFKSKKRKKAFRKLGFMKKKSTDKHAVLPTDKYAGVSRK
jgi:hypothetical protein